MKKETIMSLVLVILILGSIIGMSIGARPDQGYIEGPEKDINYDAIPVEGYYGEVQTTITETYPEIIIASKTNVFDKTTIEKDLIPITGIKRTTVNFSKLQDESIIVIIRAVIDEKEIKNIIEKINNLDYLTSEPIEYYKQGSININEKILFTNTQDQNKTLQYSFIDFRTEAIIGIETVKGDVVSGQLQASFRGEAPEQIIFYESSNITNSPRLLMDDVTLDLLEWKEEYLYNFKGPFKSSITTQEIKELLDLNQEVIINNDMRLVYNNLNLKEITLEEINVESIENIRQEENKIIFSLKQKTTLEEYFFVIETLEENGFLKEDIFSEPETYYFIESSSLIENIEETLFKKNISLTEISQKAIFDIEEITLQEEVYNYKEKLYEVWLSYPKDLKKTTFTFTAQAYAAKKDIMFITLDKKEIEE